MKYTIQIILLFISFTVLGQTYEVGEEMYVIADGGLNLRAVPRLEGEIISTIARGDVVQIKQLPGYDSTTLPNGYSGKWVKIQSDGKEGYVFDAYLSKRSPFRFSRIDKNGCWENDVLRDFAVNIGIIDSIDYNNFADGEGTHRMSLFQLKNGDKYIEHFYWEHYENEIQLFGLRNQEIDQYFKSIAAFCSEYEKDIFKLLLQSKSPYHDFWIHRDCCLHKLRIKVVDDTLIVQTQIWPGS